MRIVRPSLLVLLLLVVADLFLFGFSTLFVYPLHFLFGWIFSIVRLAEHIQFSWPVAWWIAGLIAFVLLLSWFCAGFKTAGARLRIVSTFTAMTLCVILAGMSLAGSVHQVAWLATSEEPWIGRSFGSRRAALNHAGMLAGELMESDSTREKWEKAWRGVSENGVPDRARPDFHSHFATHLRTNRDGIVEEVVLWPRNGDDFRKIGGMIVNRPHGWDAVSRETLLTYLQMEPKVIDER